MNMHIFFLLVKLLIEYLKMNVNQWLILNQYLINDLLIEYQYH